MFFIKPFIYITYLSRFSAISINRITAARFRKFSKNFAAAPAKMSLRGSYSADCFSGPLCVVGVLVPVRVRQRGGLKILLYLDANRIVSDVPQWLGGPVHSKSRWRRRMGRTEPSQANCAAAISASGYRHEPFAHLGMQPSIADQHDISQVYHKAQGRDWQV